MFFLRTTRRFCYVRGNWSIVVFYSAPNKKRKEKKKGNLTKSVRAQQFTLVRISSIESIVSLLRWSQEVSVSHQQSRWHFFHWLNPKEKLGQQTTSGLLLFPLGHSTNSGLRGSRRADAASEPFTHSHVSTFEEPNLTRVNFFGQITKNRKKEGNKTTALRERCMGVLSE